MELAGYIYASTLGAMAASTSDARAVNLHHALYATDIGVDIIRDGMTSREEAYAFSPRAADTRRSAQRCIYDSPRQADSIILPATHGLYFRLARAASRCTALDASILPLLSRIELCLSRRINFTGLYSRACSYLDGLPRRQKHYDYNCAHIADAFAHSVLYNFREQYFECSRIILLCLMTIASI